MNRVHTSITRLLALALVATAALALAGCADGPGNGTTSSGTTSSGMTSGGTSGGGGGGGGNTSGGTSGGTTPCVAGQDGCTTPISVMCPQGETFTQILATPDDMVKVTHVDATSASCVNCSVVDGIDVVDQYTDNFAIMSIPVGVAGSNSLTVSDPTTIFPTGSEGGYLVSIPGAPVLSLSLLQGVNVTTYNGTTQVDSGGISSPVALDLLGVLGNPAIQFVTPGPSSAPFNAATLTFSANAAGVLSQLRVYGAGACQPTTN